jgi:hypothetical protein
MQSLQHTADKFNALYVQAKETREFAVSLESEPNNQEASKHWHEIADALMEAVSIYDGMVTASNKPLWARPKQKTM